MIAYIRDKYFTNIFCDVNEEKIQVQGCFESSTTPVLVCVSIECYNLKVILLRIQEASNCENNGNKRYQIK